jgi:hypothetical protein
MFLRRFIVAAAGLAAVLTAGGAGAESVNLKLAEKRK